MKPWFPVVVIQNDSPVPKVLQGLLSSASSHVMQLSHGTPVNPLVSYSLYGLEAAENIGTA
jgi:hypothetical protein